MNVQAQLGLNLSWQDQKTGYLLLDTQISTETPFCAVFY